MAWPPKLSVLQNTMGYGSTVEDCVAASQEGPTAWFCDNEWGRPVKLRDVPAHPDTRTGPVVRKCCGEQMCQVLSTGLAEDEDLRALR